MDQADDPFSIATRHQAFRGFHGWCEPQGHEACADRGCPRPGDLMGKDLDLNVSSQVPGPLAGLPARHFVAFWARIAVTIQMYLPPAGSARLHGTVLPPV